MEQNRCSSVTCCDPTVTCYHLPLPTHSALRITPDFERDFTWPKDSRHVGSREIGTLVVDESEHHSFSIHFTEMLFLISQVAVTCQTLHALRCMPSGMPSRYMPNVDMPSVTRPPVASRFTEMRFLTLARAPGERRASVTHASRSTPPFHTPPFHTPLVPRHPFHTPPVPRRRSSRNTSSGSPRCGWTRARVRRSACSVRSYNGSTSHPTASGSRTTCNGM